MNAPRALSDANIYHITARGVGKQLIFEDDADRRTYLSILKTALGECNGEILAWCLMDNHVHLLFRLELKSVSAIMQKVNRTYSRRFNLRYGRSGHLFQGRFGSEAVNSEEQLLATVRYIHQNPWKGGLSNNCQYPWSSYASYLTGRGSTSTALILSLFDSLDDFVRFNHTAGRSGEELAAGHRAFAPEDVLVVAREALDPLDPATIKELPKAQRNDALARLKNTGLSLRQIERITGIPKSIVSRA